MEDAEHKHGCFSHARLGLADDVAAENGLRNALVLHFRGVLETVVLNSLHQLGTQEEISEA